jgi:hypothetical protein
MTHCKQHFNHKSGQQKWYQTTLGPYECTSIVGAFNRLGSTFANKNKEILLSTATILNLIIFIIGRFQELWSLASQKE